MSAAQIFIDEIRRGVPPRAWKRFSSNAPVFGLTPEEHARMMGRYFAEKIADMLKADSAAVREWHAEKAASEGRARP